MSDATPPEPKMNPQEIAHALTSLSDYLAAAQSLTEEGLMPDMQQIQERVAVICNAIEASDKEVQVKALPALSTLIEQLNTCETSVRSWYSKNQMKIPQQDENQ
ncbi:MAG: hypothetical protein JO126_05320 [Alphaproteobacteria bacterium]|nr:hypothetical protein [Alphaproteobacteria bacterium]